MDLHERLKAETSVQHRQLEERLNLMRDDFDRSQLVRLLERFYGYYVPCEEQIEQLPGPIQVLLAERHKVPLLAADLKFFGHTDQTLSALPRCPDTRVNGTAEALGRWYVLEGSTLGGQFLTRQFEATLGLRDRGLAFFRSYGEQVGAMWKDYCKALEQFSSREIDDDVVHSANRTFATLSAWLV